jgi:uncharacterized protein
MVTIVKTLDEVREILAVEQPRLCEMYKITALGIFGSYARGQQTEFSDIDVLVDYVQAPTLLNLIELRDHLSLLFGLKVDVVTRNGLKPRIRACVLKEAIYV